MANYMDAWNVKNLSDPNYNMLAPYTPGRDRNL